MDIKNIVITSFQSTYNLNQNDTSLNSDKFKAELTNNIFKEYSPELYEKRVIDIENNKRKSGEWLLDGFILKKKVFRINNQEELPVKLGGCWAIESELDVSHKAFVTDFSKLLCVRSENYIYVNGINQRTRKGRENYIKERLKSVKQILDATISETTSTFKLYYSFCPTTWMVAYDRTFWELYKWDKRRYLDMSAAETLIDLIQTYRFQYSTTNGQYISDKI